MKRFHSKHKRFSLTLTHEGSLQGIFGSTKAKFSAHNAGCSSVPKVVHDGAPFAISEDLHAALAQSGAGLQSHRLYKATKEKKTSANAKFVKFHLH